MHQVHITQSVCFSPTSENGHSDTGLEPASYGNEAAQEGRLHSPRWVSGPAQTVHRDGGVILQSTGRAPITTAGCWEQRGDPRGFNHVSATTLGWAS